MCRSSEYSCTHDISIAGTHSIPSSAAVADRLGHAGDAVVVGEGHHGDPGLVRRRGRRRRARAGRRRRLNVTEDRSCGHSYHPVNQPVMRISAKADYAVRASARARGEPGRRRSRARSSPRRRRSRCSSSSRSCSSSSARRSSAPSAARAAATGSPPSPTTITVADVIRAVEGPLANIHDLSPEETSYPGPARRLRDVWIAVRVNLRAVLEEVTLAELVAGELPAAGRRPDRRARGLGGA